MFPCDVGRSVRKSIDKCDHGRCGMGKGCNLPLGTCLGALHWAHRAGGNINPHVLSQSGPPVLRSDSALSDRCVGPIDQPVTDSRRNVQTPSGTIEGSGLCTQCLLNVRVQLPHYRRHQAGGLVWECDPWAAPLCHTAGTVCLPSRSGNLVCKKG